MTINTIKHAQSYQPCAQKVSFLVKMFAQFNNYLLLCKRFPVYKEKS